MNFRSTNNGPKKLESQSRAFKDSPRSPDLQKEQICLGGATGSQTSVDTAAYLTTAPSPHSGFTLAVSTER